MQHLDIKIFGNVQGVLFRFKAKQIADKLSIYGYIKNQPDGSVFVEAEGEKKALEKFVDWCHDGPELAKVEKVLIEIGKIKKFSNFNIYET